jgi:7-keto-8-aminopelargonate synthetase-like enzyme
MPQAPADASSSTHVTEALEERSELERALSWSVADHQSAPGKWFSARYLGLADDVSNASSLGLWQYFRTHQRRIEATAEVVDEAGRNWSGINVASQDYLGLSQHPAVIAAAVEAIETLGAHSSGSAPMGGGSRRAGEIERRLAAVLGKDNVVLFPTGWAAGYGIIAGLVRPHDHVVIDALAHNCLQHGARAATPNVSLFIHNSMPSLEKRLERIRRQDPDAAILIVTESLFSMDSDGPDLRQLVELKTRYDAHLLVDIAHDFGVLGPDGSGIAAEQGGYGGVDYLIGSFSKSFASIGGFTATADLASSRAVQGYSGSYTFSNYLTPGQLGAISAALGIAFSADGAARRRAVLGKASRLRQALARLNHPPLGNLSTMVIVPVGAEAVARLAYRELLADGVVLNCIEFPAVRRGEARFRLQLTPDHADADIELVAEKIAMALGRAAAARA